MDIQSAKRTQHLKWKQRVQSSYINAYSG